MTPSGIHINKPLVGAVVGVFVLVIVGYKYLDQIKGTVMSKTWKIAEFKSLPAEAKNELDKVNVKEDDLKIQVDGQEVIVHYRQAEPDVCSLDVLFLHGQAFSSETWFNEPMWSLQTLSKLGYKAVAIDLPGKGKSKAATVDPAKYLEEVIKGLKLNKPVIISPSMSGGYSLPYLFKDPAAVLTRARGFVPVAPVGTSRYTKEQYESLKIPTMIICGDQDKSIGPKSVKDLQQLPNSELFMYKDANHPAYLRRPDDFHKDLHNFFLMLLTEKHDV